MLRSFTRAFAAFVTASFVACSSSSSSAPPADAAVIDAPPEPLLCGLPVPSICPTTAPCSASTWGCTETACQGYFVVTDGAWIYYYSLPGGELAGEIAAGDDAGLVSCPYEFQVPTACVPIAAPSCAAGADAGGGGDASREAGGDAGLGEAGLDLGD